ncbi:hypothetical protein PQX77_007177 [Marasmius sp. AFHP31]|nr:hypothetical protein PQX77_007177 [Marasmius sp. AFHP31]
MLPPSRRTQPRLVRTSSSQPPKRIRETDRQTASLAASRTASPAAISAADGLAAIEYYLEQQISKGPQGEESDLSLQLQEQELEAFLESVDARFGKAVRLRRCVHRHGSIAQVSIGMPSFIHERTGLALYEFIIGLFEGLRDNLGLNRNIKPQRKWLTFCGATRSRFWKEDGTAHAKEPDQALKSVFRDKKIFAWPAVPMEVGVSQSITSLLQRADDWMSLIVVRVVLIVKINLDKQIGSVSLYERRALDDTDVVKKDETTLCKKRWNWEFGKTITPEQSMHAAESTKLYVLDFFLHGPTLLEAKKLLGHKKLKREVPPEL